MAHNRMFLIHRESKLGIGLDKRMGWGWYSAPDQFRFQQFYDYLSENYFDQQDSFVLAMEDCSESNCFDDWVYTFKKEAGFHLFEFKNSNDKI